MYTWHYILACGKVVHVSSFLELQCRSLCADRSTGRPADRPFCIRPFPAVPVPFTMSFLYPPLEAAAAETTEVISLEDDDDEHDDGGVDKDKKNKVVVSGSSLSRDGSSYNTERKRFENRYYLSTSEAYSSWNQQYDNVMKLEDLDEQESDTTSIRAEKARRFQSISYMGRLGVPTPGDYLKRCAKQWKQEYREYKEIWQDPDTKKMDRYPQN